MTLAAYRDSVSSYSWQLKSAGASAAGAHETMCRSKSEMLPEISAAASASKSFHEMAGNRLWGFFIKPQVVQTVYAGGGLRAAYRKAESDYRSALGDEQAARLDVRYAADYAYWNVSAMQLFMSAAEEYVSIIESLYRVVERRFGEGYIAKSDLLQVETRLSDAEYQLQTARRAYAEVLHAFNSQFGAELDRAARLAESITDTLPMPVRVTAGDMLSRRPDILAAAERVTAAEHAVDVTRAAYNPSGEHRRRRLVADLYISGGGTDLSRRLADDGRERTDIPMGERGGMPSRQRARPCGYGVCACIGARCRRPRGG